MPGKLDGKVAFITGVARGQGRAHALRLAHEGANIGGIDICSQMETVGYPLATEDDLEHTVKLVEQSGGRMIGRVGDVRDRPSIETAFKETVAELGRVDFVIANAGIMPIWGDHCQTMQAWQDCIDVMLTGVLHTVEVAYPRMVEQGTGGSIVITSSIGSVKPMMRTLDAKTLGMLSYTAVKAGVVNLMENYASILASYRIRVNTLHPAVTQTPMTDNDMSRDRMATADPEDLKAFSHALPVDAMEPEEMSAAVAWLCSDDSRYFTGNQMLIDAGAHLR
jgi:SDR family mycofactocin-dependent oxidoreductase